MSEYCTPFILVASHLSAQNLHSPSVQWPIIIMGNFCGVQIFTDFVDRLVYAKIKTMGVHKLQEGELRA